MTGRKQAPGHLLILLAVLAIAAACLPAAMADGAEGKRVRVGWFESPFNTTGENGRRSGYAYEYQQKISAFTGWTYEYVEGSWPKLLQMLIDGKIDLLSDVSYTQERSGQMLFSALPMGSEEYYIFAAPGNDQITAGDYGTFNGKKVGVNKGSVQADFFRKWAEANHVQAELIEMTESVSEGIAMLNRGAIDLYIALDAYLDAGEVVPVCEIGASDFYFAVSNDPPELLAELNAAMTRIDEENKYYNQTLNSKYIKTAGINYYLTAEEKDWLAGHGAIAWATRTTTWPTAPATRRPAS